MRKLTQQDGPGDQPAVNALSSDGLTLTYPLKVYAVLDRQCGDLIEKIIGAKSDGFLRVPRSLRQWITDQLSLLDPASIASVVIKSSGETELEPEQADDLRQLAMYSRDAALACLNMVAGACQKDRPRGQTVYDGPVHHITITEEGDIRGDFARPLNQARRGAIYILAQLGTAQISTLEFAMRYTRRLLPEEVTESNHNNTFNQAMAGLKKSLPHLGWEVTERRNHRRVLALVIDNRAADDLLEAQRDQARYDAPGASVDCSEEGMQAVIKAMA